jgi:hypothetical protein
VTGEIFLSKPDMSVSMSMDLWQFDFRLAAQCRTGDTVDTSFDQRYSLLQNDTHNGYSFHLARSATSRKCQFSFVLFTPAGIAFSQVLLPLWDIGVEIGAVGISSRQAIFMSDSKQESVLWVAPFQKLPPQMASISSWNFTLIPGSPGACKAAGRQIIPTHFVVYSGISLEATIQLSAISPRSPLDLHDCIIAAESYEPFSIPGKITIPGTWIGLTPSVRLWNTSRVSDLSAMQHAVMEVIIDHDIDVYTAWHLRADGIFPWCKCSLPDHIFSLRLYDSINVWRLSFQVPNISGCSLSLYAEKSGMMKGRRIEIKSAPVSLGTVSGSASPTIASPSSISFSIRLGSNNKPQYWRSVPQRVKDHVSSWVASVFSAPDIGYLTLHSDLSLEYSEETDVAIRFLTDDSIAACLIQKRNCANQTALELWGAPFVSDYTILPTGFSFWCARTEDHVASPHLGARSTSWLPFHWINVVVILLSFLIVLIGTLIWRSRRVQGWLDVNVWLLNPDQLHSDMNDGHDYEPVDEIELKDVDAEMLGDREECPICLDEIADAECEPCKHRFCQKCITQLKGRCAVCRSPFASALVFKLSSNDESEAEVAEAEATEYTIS